MDYSTVKLIPPDNLSLPIHGQPHLPANHDLIRSEQERLVEQVSDVLLAELQVEVGSVELVAVLADQAVVLIGDRAVPPKRRDKL